MLRVLTETWVLFWNKLKIHKNGNTCEVINIGSRKNRDLEIYEYMVRHENFELNILELLKLV